MESWHVGNLQPLRSGAYGDLFVGTRSDTGERVAVKFLRDYHLEHARKGFEREIGVLRNRRRGLVPLIYANMKAAPPYYIMPYFPGGSLTRYAGTLSADQLQNVAVELANTLASLHSAFELHGDFKPDNILVTHDGRLQVGDPLGNGTIFTMLFSENRGGTPGYWAPEVYAGGAISRASDIHSYGATLAHLLTGIRPNDGQPLPSNFFYRRNSRIEEIILACCQIDPNARPTISEVLGMLAGKRWADIQSERLQRQQFVSACCVVALAAVGVAALRAK